MCDSCDNPCQPFLSPLLPPCLPLPSSPPLPLPRHHRHCPRTPTAHLCRPLQALQSASTRRHRKCSLGSDIWLLLTTTPSSSESGGGWYYPPPNGYNFPTPPPPFPILPYCPYYYYTPLPSDFMNSSVLLAKHFVFVTLHPFEQGEEKGTTHEVGFLLLMLVVLG
ncbi:hypothetical protein RHMOL_Rhmol01G0304600 [Rhododendron molle]|uniref:Uncharacterized protein n=1 Tax=Rhododendron molle TaxID=49168 RepID=A0ACC0Q8R4_RHOML|nr:hypothetical protein RHMOL_Rhmol01G0304600 [Rhododendron molle]